MKFRFVQPLFLSLRCAHTQVALSVALTLFFLFFLVFQLMDRPTSIHVSIPPSSSFLSFLESKGNNLQDIVNQEILLTDTEPLFLPTPFSSTSFSSHTLPLNPDINCFSIQPHIHHLNKENLHSLFNTFLPTIHTPTEAFDLSLSNFAETFGPKSTQTLSSTVTHPLYLQVSPLNHSVEPLYFSIHSNLVFKKDRLFTPCEFYILIYNHSIIGNIRMITTSGHEDLDDQLKTFILTSPEITNLHDGYYQLTVGN